jgi:Lon-like ATP-dependent protease
MIISSFAPPSSPLSSPLITMFSNPSNLWKRNITRYLNKSKDIRLFNAPSSFFPNHHDCIGNHVAYSRVFSRSLSSSSSSDVAYSNSRDLFDPSLPFGQLGKSVDKVAILSIDKPILPGLTVELNYFNLDTKTQNTLQQCLNANLPYIGLFLPKQASNTEDNPSNTGELSSSQFFPNKSAAANEESKGEGKEVNLTKFKSIESLDEVHEVGVLASFHISGSKLRAAVHRRIQINNPTGENAVNDRVAIAHLEDSFGTVDESEFSAYVKEIMSTLTELISIGNTEVQRRSGLIYNRIMKNVDVNQPDRAGDIYATIAKATPAQLQEILETLDVKTRLSKTLVLLKLEQEEAKLQQSIYNKVQEKFAAQQQKHMLKEQKKVIDSMLGIGKGDKETLKNKFESRLANKIIPEEVKRVIDEELNKFNSIESESQEFNVTRNYLDWLTQIPWGVKTKENYSIKEAEKILNSQHYGMEDVKLRILEIIASGLLLGNMPKGKILCLVGPPGVGKTSIGKSIALSLSREFYRFSVGGLDDVAEIKGHRRTYIGSMPGKLVQCLKLTQCVNPVILIDEIDKLGRGTRGDPAAALLEVLDPEQNSNFIDHYLDVPVDLSNVLFICTANSTDTIPGPLADRMDFIQLSGYMGNEKLFITQNYLEPTVRVKTGIKANQLNLTEQAILHLIRWYCREAGVRSLQKYLEKIYRKVALIFARNEAQECITITDKNLHEYVGKPLYSSDRLYEITPVGVSMGLAWTSQGGSCIFIESTIADQKITSKPNISNSIEKNKKNKSKDSSSIPIPVEFPIDTAVNSHSNSSSSEQSLYIVGRGELFCTGQMGDVMKESSSIAYTVAKKQLQSITPNNNYFHTNRLHLHVPSGSTPKDGPSAGITMVTSLLSLAFNTPAKQSLAMTGELTLTGKVLAIGGVKEKLMAAKHAQVKEIIIPKDNSRDYYDTPLFIRQGIQVHFVDNYTQVFDIAFPNISINQNNNINQITSKVTQTQATL